MNPVSISIVLYKQEKALFVTVLKHLVVAAENIYLIHPQPILLIILDNSRDKKGSTFELLAQDIWTGSLEFIHSPQNLGYAKGHNQAIKKSQSDYHLILNPDVLLDPDALVHALNYLQTQPSAVLISPDACTEKGKKQYLCKAYPSVFDLFLRGFAPKWCQHFFSKRLAAYELKGHTEQSIYTDAPIASGCFMFIRRQSFNAVGGFSEQFFLYFEDFDLSFKLKHHGQLIYLPDVKIIHFGGQAAKKGVKHILLFGRAMYTFFNTHGWRWY